MGGGEGASDALKPPATWSPLADPNTPQLVRLDPAKDAAEWKCAVDAFMATLSPSIKVVSVERIQNMPMWQSYAVKRQTILTRERCEPGSAAARRIEREWLFHGTDEGTVQKVIEMGFNRSFAGKNATAYGKGVYFASSASYSSSTQYSKPNASGVQNMFLVRVVVGEYCQGKRDQLVPDVRKGNLLYDATVNNQANPSIFVTYHDAQAYPAYLIKFKQ